MYVFLSDGNAPINTKVLISIQKNSGIRIVLCCVNVWKNSILFSAKLNACSLSRNISFEVHSILTKKVSNISSKISYVSLFLYACDTYLAQFQPIRYSYFHNGCQFGSACP